MKTLPPDNTVKDLAKLLGINRQFISEDDLQCFVGIEFEFRQWRNWWPATITKVALDDSKNLYSPVFSIQCVEEADASIKTLKWLVQEVRCWVQAKARQQASQKETAWMEASKILEKLVAGFTYDHPETLVGYVFEENFLEGVCNGQVVGVVERKGDILSGSLFVVQYAKGDTAIKNLVKIKENIVKTLKRKHSISESMSEADALVVLEILEGTSPSNQNKVEEGAFPKNDMVPTENKDKESQCVKKSKKQKRKAVDISPSSENKDIWCEEKLDNLPISIIFDSSKKMCSKNQQPSESVGAFFQKVCEPPRSKLETKTCAPGAHFSTLNQSVQQSTHKEDESLPISVVFKRSVEPTFKTSPNSSVSTQHTLQAVPRKNLGKTLGGKRTVEPTFKTSTISSVSTQHTLQAVPRKNLGETLGGKQTVDNATLTKISTNAGTPASTNVINPTGRERFVQKLTEILGEHPAKAIEEALYLAVRSIPDAAQKKNEYNCKARSIIFNLKHNRVLYERVKSGTTSANDLVKAGPDDLKTEESKLEKEKICQKMFEKSRSDWHVANAEKLNKVCGIKANTVDPELQIELGSPSHSDTASKEDSLFPFHVDTHTSKTPSHSDTANDSLFPFLFGTHIRKNSSEWRQVMTEVFQLVGLDYQPETETDFFFPGAKATPLCTGDLLPNNMLVTWRAEGLRAMLFAKGQGHCYIIDRSLNCQKTALHFPCPDNPNNSLESTLIDGLFVKTQNTKTSDSNIRYLAFDLLVFQGRKITDLDLCARIHRLKADIVDIRARIDVQKIFKRAQPPFNIKLKEHYPLEKTSHLYGFTPPDKHPVRGLIFTPHNKYNLSFGSASPGLLKSWVCPESSADRVMSWDELKIGIEHIIQKKIF